jgi:hypothetical protein
MQKSDHITYDLILTTMLVSRVAENIPSSRAQACTNLIDTAIDMII